MEGIRNDHMFSWNAFLLGPIVITFLLSFILFLGPRNREWNILIAWLEASILCLIITFLMPLFFTGISLSKGIVNEKGFSCNFSFGDEYATAQFPKRKNISIPFTQIRCVYLSEPSEIENHHYAGYMVLGAGREPTNESQPLALGSLFVEHLIPIIRK